MTNTSYTKSLTQFLVGFVVLVFVVSAAFSVKAQNAKNAPETQVAGIRLGDEESGKAFLAKFAPRSDPSGQPVYYFYNKYATEVMKLTAFSERRPYLIVGAEVYSVGKSYRAQHFQINETASFATESGFFVGVRQSAKSLLFGVAEKTDTEKLTKVKGDPSSRTENAKRETLVYNFNDVEISAVNKPLKISRYAAVYEFYKDKLKKFSISVELAN